MRTKEEFRAGGILWSIPIEPLKYGDRLHGVRFGVLRSLSLQVHAGQAHAALGDSTLKCRHRRVRSARPLPNPKSPLVTPPRLVETVSPGMKNAEIMQAAG